MARRVNNKLLGAYLIASLLVPWYFAAKANGRIPTLNIPLCSAAGLHPIAVNDLQDDSKVTAPNCEGALLTIDNAVEAARKVQDTHMFIISRLGKLERNKNLSNSRLGFIEARLKHLGYLNYVSAVGKKSKGLGRVEIYVGGKLFAIMALKKNSKYFCADSVGL
jgi:hypothetical protein